LNEDHIADNDEYGMKKQIVMMKTKMTLMNMKNKKLMNMNNEEDEGGVNDENEEEAGG
jgi:hypothetical protein